MGILLASRLKERRKALKLSQKELAEGVCKQGQISRIENGEYTPGSELLYALSRKLRVSMDYFFDEQVQDEKNELENFRLVAENFISQRDYSSLKYLYNLESKSSSHLSLSDKMYLEWIQTLVLFYCDDNKFEAVSKLEKLLKERNISEINYLRFSNTLFNFYYDIDNLNQFNEIRDNLEKRVNNLIIHTIEELELSIKFNYNISRYLWLQNNVEDALNKISETIRICKRYRSNYLLADLYLLLGNASASFGNIDEVRDYYTKAKFLYNLDGNQEMSLKVEHYLAEKLMSN
ncbi:helix-turn-helix domain-containing protein [Streptococcus salivarius]|uniref:helix-turn-helix domain-containing protein n=1 Tax=Streptococcus salivarius TaxID=1304 RepID=UPI000A111D47|nr:helix-turn-helix transcriptional regulator [Streptococcus salivarius]MBS7055237.1 helix-turn-helix transcriptional regulator [Streptococcus salivarius]MTQ57674.1 helix-turn-helix domain-containing protein [Streptococcus salivarius]NGG28160.1 helix-turn-helix transcriptional regulator [Streptococcus salivarius]